MVCVGCCQRDRQGRNNHQKNERTSRSRYAGVFTKTDVSDNGNERRANEVAGSTNSENGKRTGQQLYCTAHYPKAYNEQQRTDWHAANFSFAYDQPHTHC